MSIKDRCKLYHIAKGSYYAQLRRFRKNCWQKTDCAVQREAIGNQSESFRICRTAQIRYLRIKFRNVTKVKETQRNNAQKHRHTPKKEEGLCFISAGREDRKVYGSFPQRIYDTTDILEKLYLGEIRFCGKLDCSSTDLLYHSIYVYFIL